MYKLKLQCKKLWAKYRSLPWYAQVLLGVLAGGVLGRMGAPWLI